MSLKFVPKGPIDNNAASVQIIVWPRIGDKPLSEPMLTRVTCRISVAPVGDELSHDMLSSVDYGAYSQFDQNVMETDICQ